MGQIITFYSYKGGVGRTMALANVAVLLAQWKYKVLIVDWDLEAPGLEYFFKDYLDLEAVAQQIGIIDFLDYVSKTGSENPLDWRDFLINISIPDIEGTLHFLTAGERSAKYFNKVRNLDVNTLYLEKDGGNFVESLRNEWKEEYDFVLIDSRTGITDIGGICTIQLPDMLILLFLSTEQSLDGVIDVAKKATVARQKLPIERLGLVSLPIPSKFDAQEEFKISQEWLDRFASELSELYTDWLPTSVKIRTMLEITKIPYVPYFSFGEKLPVLEQGTIDPAGLGYAYENLTALIANNLESVELLQDDRDQYIRLASKRRGKSKSIGPEKISLAKLPSTSPDLFGREKEQAILDAAWNNPKTNIVSLVAFGGVGKTALVNKWLLQMGEDNYRGAERVYGWSFYSQGAAEGKQASADLFIASALKWFGDPNPDEGSPWEKGERLAELVKKQWTLLIIDGLEPLQTPPGKAQGSIKDQGLQCLLRELAHWNLGLCIITTRLNVYDIQGFVGTSVERVYLENLLPEGGVKLLEHLGVKGTPDELKQAVVEFEGHALALTLLGRYLVDVHDGDIRKRDLIPMLTSEEQQGAHVKKMMDAYEKWFDAKPEQNILRIMGLFDRLARGGGQ